MQSYWMMQNSRVKGLTVPELLSPNQINVNPGLMWQSWNIFKNNIFGLTVSSFQQLLVVALSDLLLEWVFASCIVCEVDVPLDNIVALIVIPCVWWRYDIDYDHNYHKQMWEMQKLQCYLKQSNVCFVCSLHLSKQFLDVVYLII